MNTSKIEGLIEAFLQKEAADKPSAAEEILQLKLGEIIPNQDGSAMVYFEGPDEFRIWHCDYKDGQLTGLTFDN